MRHLWVAALLLVACGTVPSEPLAPGKTATDVRTTGALTPLPLDIKITSPRVEIPQDMAAFSGKWVGMWDGQLRTTLVVEEITPPTAKVIYSWGDNPRSDIQAGFARYVAKIGHGKLQFGDPEKGITITFTISKDFDRVEGVYERLRVQSWATLQRVKE